MEPSHKTLLWVLNRQRARLWRAVRHSAPFLLHPVLLLRHPLLSSRLSAIAFLLLPSSVSLVDVCCLSMCGLIPSSQPASQQAFGEHAAGGTRLECGGNGFSDLDPTPKDCFLKYFSFLDYMAPLFKTDVLFKAFRYS